MFLELVSVRCRYYNGLIAFTITEKDKSGNIHIFESFIKDGETFDVENLRREIQKPNRYLLQPLDGLCGSEQTTPGS